MGVKRPLEEENLPELSFEQPKQFDSNKKLAFMTEDFPSHATAQQVDPPDSDGALESGCCMADSFIADEEVEASEEDVGIKNSSFCSNFRRYINFNMPYRPPDKFDDPYIYLLNVPPRKEIPVGPDHQAEVPKWDQSAGGKAFPANNYTDNDWEQKWMGTSITVMPDLNDSSTDGFAVGRGRTTDCSCHDMGSMRCVQQHVREARDKLREILGDGLLTKLGFCEMGEEIARRWSSKDQQLFHEIAFSNPSRDFWDHFSAVFPTRTKKELVSYYFNVSVLRRRGAQNRSYLLQIDSDHDEEPKVEVVHVDYPQNRPLVDDNADDLQCTNGDFHVIGEVDDDADDLQCTNGYFHVIGEEEESEVESFSDQELDVGWVDEYGYEPESFCDDDGSCAKDVTSDGNAVKKDGVDEGSSDNLGISDGNVPKQDAVEKDGGAGQMSGHRDQLVG